MSGIDMNQFRSDVSGFQVREEILKEGSLEVGLIVICRAGEEGADTVQMKPWTSGNLARVWAGISVADPQSAHPCIDQEMNLDLSTQAAGQLFQLCDPPRRMNRDGDLTIDDFWKFGGKQGTENEYRSFDTLITEIDGFTGSSDSKVVNLLFL